KGREAPRWVRHGRSWRPRAFMWVESGSSGASARSVVRGSPCAAMARRDVASSNLAYASLAPIRSGRGGILASGCSGRGRDERVQEAFRGGRVVVLQAPLEGGRIESGRVFLHHPARREPASGDAERALHEADPPERHPPFAALVVERHDLALEDVEERVVILRVDLLVGPLGTGQRPAVVPGEALGPPSVERAQLWHAVE